MTTKESYLVKASLLRRTAVSKSRVSPRQDTTPKIDIIAGLPPEAKEGQLVTLDFEMFQQTKGKLHRPTGTFACISVKLQGDPKVYQLYDEKDLKKLSRVISKGTWTIHNAMYDMRQYRRFYPELKPRFIHDIMLFDQSMQGGLFQTFNLADMARRWLQVQMNKETREHFLTVTEMSPEMKQYAALDVVITEQIAEKQLLTYEHDPATRAYYLADEPMIFPLLDLQGFRVDVGKWEEMVKEFERMGRAIEDEIDLNVFSHAKVKAKLASQGLHLPNTANETLVEHLDNPLVVRIIEARMYRKASSTYGMKWLEENVEGDGKVYSNYKITGALTGRMSSSEPNMQNIPQRKLPEYRERFLASPGNVMEIWDVAQQEPCITAYHSQDRKLIEALLNKHDLHLAVAWEIYENPKLTKADKTERSHGKAINLGLVYGLTPYGLARRTKMSEDDAEAMIKKYFQRFSGVYSYIQIQRQKAYRDGFITTALGRKSYINVYDRKWENNAINSPIQGGAADFTKIWARKTWEKVRSAGLPQTTVGYIHDETVRDTPKEVVKDGAPLVEEAFKETAEMLYKNIPFAVDREFGRSWAAKSIETEWIDLGDE